MHPLNQEAMKRHMMRIKIATQHMGKIMSDPETPVEEKGEGYKEEDCK